MTQDEFNTNILEEVFILSTLVYAVIKKVTEILILAEYVNNIVDLHTEVSGLINQNTDLINSKWLLHNDEVDFRKAC